MKPNNAETGIETLRPCPFCGGRATSRACCENREHWYISCNKCHFEMRSIARGLPDTAERWNTRPAPLPDASLIERARHWLIANDYTNSGSSNYLKTVGNSQQALKMMAAFTAEILAEMKERLEAEREGHGKPCYYCGHECNSLAGNPSKWPIPLCHSDEPGKVKWHHIGCVSERLQRLTEAEKVVDHYADAKRALATK